MRRECKSKNDLLIGDLEVIFVSHPFGNGELRHNVVSVRKFANLVL